MSVLSLVPDEKRSQKNSLTSVYSSNSRLNLLHKRKRMNPLTLDMSAIGKGDRYVTQRVLSAKTHRVKQLQNQLADAHFHLQELSNENKILRAVQKKHEIALQRYENSNAELPQVLSSHTEEIRIQQSKYKQLKQQFKEVSQKLKERDLQFQQLKDEHQHLLDLSRDKNLLEREKLQYQYTDLTAKVQQQNETINMLQRRIALEAKNFKHQLQAEINKHKDTRHDLDLAINNADKLSTIIEMKEKMLSTVASRGASSTFGSSGMKSPTKSASLANFTRTVNKTSKEPTSRGSDERNSGDLNILAKMCENSRNLSSALSQEDTSSSEPRSRLISSRTNSTSTRSTPNQNRKSSKGSDDILELARTVQDGMADLAIIDDDMEINSRNEMQIRMESMKTDLMMKIRNNEEPLSRKSSAIRRQSTEESIEEQIFEENERPKSRGRRNSSVSFFDSANTADVSVSRRGTGDEGEKIKVKRENSISERKLSGKSVDKYCKDVFQDIEKSSKIIDVHMKQLSQTKFAGDKLIEQLHAVDKINEIVNARGDVPSEALSELNNNFHVISEQVLTEALPVTRKRSVSGRRNLPIESRSNLLGDSNMTNQDMLDDLLGKK